MKLTTRSAMLPALLASALAIFAAEFWNAKDYTQWTDDEIARILNDSPWSRPTGIAFDLPGMQPDGGPRRGGTFPGDGGYSGGTYPRRGRDPDDLERPREPRGLPSILATIRWESALPVRQALRRSGAGTVADVSETGYVIVVLGLPLPGPPGDAKTPPGRDPEEVRDELVASTKLVRKGKAAITPSEVKVDPGKAGGTVRFSFPKKDPITLDDKEVTFETQLGKMRLERKIRLKDMTYKGKLEL